MNYDEYGAKLKVISDPKRMKILDLLSCGEMCACDILEYFDFTQPTLSHHMKALEKSDFIQVNKTGKWSYYRLNQKTLDTFIKEFNQLFSHSAECVCQKNDTSKEN